MRIKLVIPIVLILGSCQSVKHQEYLDYVENYATALLEHARDRYGDEESPLIASTLIRESLTLPDGDSLEADSD